MNARVELPAGRHYALTWGIPDDFGGMTSALLRRSRAFVRLGGVEVDVLTFDDRPDYDRVEADLRARDELIDGMRLLNLWQWLATHDIDAAEVRHEFTPLGDGQTERRGDDGTVLQVDRYRADGSLLASDRRDIREPGVIGGRSIVLCDARGMPVRSWGRSWSLYRFWLDQLRQRRPSFMITDSKTVARFMTTYRRKRAVIVHVVHNSHLQADGGLRESRREVFENLASFDSVVLLSDRQRDDVERLLGPQPHLGVIGNSRELPARTTAGRAGGIMLGSLDRRKRVDHAIGAVGEQGLDIYGDGPERAKLEGLAGLSRQARPSARITFHGHTPNARARLAEASYLLLTSSSEGFPLAIVEAMAAGCIPIAYNVDYGPADIIRHGRNGLLVAAGDVAALSAAVRDLEAMPPRRVAAMRRSARRTASAYSDLAITRAWARELRTADARKAAAWLVALSA